jgi:acetyl-CoA carboxylase carboxyltransferase component
VIRDSVRSRHLGDRAQDGDGVVTGTATVGGRPVACYAQDSALLGGSLGEAHADSIVRILRLAGQAGMPVVAFVESAGARLQEAVGGLAGYARIFAETVALSGWVPQLSVITGMCAGGGAYSPALTDFVVMTGDAAMFLTGPGVVKQACGEDVSPTELGGTRVHGRNGVSHLVARDETEAGEVVRQLLSFLPQNTREPAPRATPAPPFADDPGSYIPERTSAPYDVRDVIRAIVDHSELLEVARGWARNMVTGFARIEGAPVGIVANQPRHIGGVIDIGACVKASRFIEQCETFGLPLVVFVDTPGFMPGTAQERGGIIRCGAGLVEAFAGARVPRFTVVLRKAYGGAYIAMNAKGLGATLAFAWPDAEIGIMDAAQAVRIMHKRDVARAPDPDAFLSQLADRYASEHCSALAAAREGYVDQVIAPSETRARLAAAIAGFARRSAATGEPSQVDPPPIAHGFLLDR